jgi:hypothetical protein
MRGQRSGHIDQTHSIPPLIKMPSQAYPLNPALNPSLLISAFLELVVSIGPTPGLSTRTKYPSDARRTIIESTDAKRTSRRGNHIGLGLKRHSMCAKTWRLCSPLRSATSISGWTFAARAADLRRGSISTPPFHLPSYFVNGMSTSSFEGLDAESRTLPMGLSCSTTFSNKWNGVGQRYVDGVDVGG